MVRTSFTAEPTGSRPVPGLDAPPGRRVRDAASRAAPGWPATSSWRRAARRAIAEPEPHPAGDQQQDREQAGVDRLGGVRPVAQPQPAVDDVEVVGAGDRPGQEAQRQEAVDDHEHGQVDEDRRRQVRLEPRQPDVERRAHSRSLRMSSTAPVRVSQSRTRATQPSRESPTQCTTSATTSRVRSCLARGHRRERHRGRRCGPRVTIVAGVFSRSRAGSAQDPAWWGSWLQTLCDLTGARHRA